MRKIQTGALLCLIVLLKSCNSADINFEPEFHVPSIADQSLIYCSEVDDLDNCIGNFHKVGYYQEEIERFGCLSEDKIKELIEILIRNGVPKKKADNILRRLFN